MKDRARYDADLERVIKALANRRRLVILRVLKKNTEASVGNLARAIKLSFKSTSNHLGVLSSAGIVDRTQVSTMMLYRLAPDLPDAARRIISIL